MKFARSGKTIQNGKAYIPLALRRKQVRNWGAITRTAGKIFFYTMLVTGFFGCMPKGGRMMGDIKQMNVGEKVGEKPDTLKAVPKTRKQVLQEKIKQVEGTLKAIDDLKKTVVESGGPEKEKLISVLEQSHKLLEEYLKDLKIDFGLEEEQEYLRKKLKPTEELPKLPRKMTPY